jgi:putative transposase
MKRSRFTDEQIVRILQEAGKDPVAEVVKRHRVSEPSIYAWRKKFGDLVGMTSNCSLLVQKSIRVFMGPIQPI